MTGPVSEVKLNGEDVILGIRNEQMIVFNGYLFHGFGGSCLRAYRALC